MQTLALIDSQYINIIKACDTSIEIKAIKKDYYFQNFLKKKMQLYRHFSTLIFDREILSETDDELIELIKQLRMIYPMVKLIFIYPKAEEKNPAFIQSILLQDIFNIVTADNYDKQQAELSDCLSNKGMDALKWIRLFPELIGGSDEHSKKIEKKNIFNCNFFYFNKKIYILVICVLAFSCAICADFYYLKNNSNNSVKTKAVNAQTTTSLEVTEKAISSYMPITSTLTSSFSTTQSTTQSQTSTTSKTSTSSTKASSSASTKTKSLSHQTTQTQAYSQSTSEQQVYVPPKQTTTIITTTTTQKLNVTGIQLSTGYSDNNVILSVGGSHTISAVISPSKAQNKSVTWSSNRSDIATIDTNGTIRAVGTGKAIITATSQDGGLSASCMVSVI